MVKIRPYDTEKFLDKPPENFRAVLVYGPDAGRVRLYAEKFARTQAGDKSDPFNLRSLSAEQLTADPAILAQEAGNLSLGGGRVIVRVSQAGERSVKALAQLLAAENVQGMAVLDAGALTPRSSLRQLAEKEKNIAAIACYPDSPQDLARLVRMRLKQAQLRIDDDALSLFVQKLGADRGISENEISKLVLYMGKESRQVKMQDIIEATGDMALIGFDDLAHCAGIGNILSLTRAFDRLLSAGQAPVVMLNIVSRHFQRLRAVRGKISSGARFADAIASLYPPVHFTRKDVFMHQCRIWDRKNIDDALEVLWSANAAARTMSARPETLSGQALIKIARRAQMLKKK